MSPVFILKTIKDSKNGTVVSTTRSQCEENIVDQSTTINLSTRTSENEPSSIHQPNDRTDDITEECIKFNGIGQTSVMYIPHEESNSSSKLTQDEITLLD